MESKIPLSTYLLQRSLSLLLGSGDGSIRFVKVSSIVLTSHLNLLKRVHLLHDLKIYVLVYFALKRQDEYQKKHFMNA